MKLALGHRSGTRVCPRVAGRTNGTPWACGIVATLKGARGSADKTVHVRSVVNHVQGTRFVCDGGAVFGVKVLEFW